MKYRPIYYKDGRLRLLDQSKLPTIVEYIECKTELDVFDVIYRMKISGASSIGIAAAYGVVLGAGNLVKPNGNDPQDWDECLETLARQIKYIGRANPTVANLRWVLNKMEAHARGVTGTLPYDINYLKDRLLEEANRIVDADKVACRRIGDNWPRVVKPGAGILTHGTGGALSAPENGTALCPIYAGRDAKVQFKVYCTEGRPYGQGRLTCWELEQSEINNTLVCDGAAGHLMKAGMVTVVIVGASAVAKNGDFAAEIGTYGLAVLAKQHNIPFFVAMTNKMVTDLATGDDIIIERRLIEGRWADCWPSGQAYNPSYDVTPADLVTAFLTEQGVISPGAIVKL